VRRDLPLALHVLDVPHALLARVARALRLPAPLAHHLRTNAGSRRRLRAHLLARFLGLFAIEDEDLPDLLHRMRLEALADGLEPDVALLALRGRGPHLDQLVGLQRPVDLGDHLVGEALVADEHDGAQGVRLGAQLASAFAGQWKHRGSICKPMKAGSR
jgi:hypothetical protein